MAQVTEALFTLYRYMGFVSHTFFQEGPEVKNVALPKGKRETESERKQKREREKEREIEICRVTVTKSLN